MDTVWSLYGFPEICQRLKPQLPGEASYRRYVDPIAASRLICCVCELHWNAVQNRLQEV